MFVQRYQGCLARFTSMGLCQIKYLLQMFQVFLCSMCSFIRLFLYCKYLFQQREREREGRGGGGGGGGVGGGERVGYFCKHHCHITLMDKMYLLQLSLQTLLKTIYEKKFDKSGLEII